MDLKKLKIAELQDLLDAVSEDLGAQKTYIYLSATADKDSLIKCLQDIQAYENLSLESYFEY